MRHSHPTVVLLCCELLVAGVPPSAIPKSIMTIYNCLYGENPRQVPSKNFVRQCRSVVEIVGETIVAMKLASAPSWDQTNYDATSRRQNAFQCLIVSVMGANNVLESLVVSSCIFLIDETAETTIDSLFDKVCPSVLYLFVFLNTNISLQTT